MSSDQTRYISINLQPHHVERLHRLVKWSGTNRNAFLRKVIMSMNKSDVDEMMRR